MKRGKKTLILGIGNMFQKDDGVGVHVVQYMQQHNVPLPASVKLLDGGTAGFNLIQYMLGYDKLVIIDALRVQDKPGSIYRFSGNHLKAQSPQVSLHEMGIAEVLRVLQLKGARPEVEVIGIVPEDIWSLDTSLSPSVEGSIPKVVELILDSVTAY
ncbi:MAG: HyaD/HybD family hydrogenase maturation endopeptidase [Spirochaetes bacterium]|nr:HyaD/HybD family hydrogenase maturation endopeptidase [Spirochaetota bacterium]